MTAGSVAPLILTAVLDPASQARFERERQLYFPPSRNLLPAHVTLFHHLPGDRQADIGRELQTACLVQAAAPFTATGLRFLGHGTAYLLDMPAVAAFRGRLAAGWSQWLTPQDRQRWQPHVTVQNKAAPDAAKRLHGDLLAGFTPQSGMVTGVRLWEYLGGPWKSLGHHAFCGAMA